jgi:hypothetical protein
MSFVFDGSSLPDGKSDQRTSAAPANQKYTAEEWNQVMAAVADLRTAALAGFGTLTLNDGASAVYSSNGDVHISFTDGDVDNLIVADRIVGQLRISGATAIYTPGSGASSGTAGAGTTTTQLNKPTGAGNWPGSNALKGTFVLITGGGGYDATRMTLRPVRANNTTSLTVDTLVGMDSTTQFQLVNCASLVNDAGGTEAKIQLDRCRSKIILEALAFESGEFLRLIQATDCDDITVSGCLFNTNPVASAVLFDTCRKVTFEHCVITSSSDVEMSDCRSVTVQDVVSIGGGQIEIVDCTKVSVRKLQADSAPSTVLRLIRDSYVAAEAACSGGGASPVYVEDVARLEAVDGCLTGSSNTGYGLELNGNGGGTLVGCTITGGSGDVLFNDGGATHVQTWAVLSGTDFGRIDGYAGSFSARVNSTKSVVYGNRYYDGEAGFASRLYCDGVFNFSRATGLTATGTDAASAFQIGQQTYNRFDTVASGTGAKMPIVAALAGAPLAIHNNGAHTLTLYANSGHTLDGGASITIAAGGKKLFFSSSDDGLSYESYI